MVGLYVRPSPFPNLAHPHRKGWFNVDTAFSSVVTNGSPHICASGANVTEIKFPVRLWHETTPPARALSQELDITTPGYKLAGNLDTDDAVVGIDYFNPPLAFSQFLLGNWDTNTAAAATSVARVLALKHHFKIRNYSRFPLCIYYSVYPTGFEPPDMNTSSPIRDQENSIYKKVVIAGVRDAGDKGKAGDINITMNLEKLFPDQYTEPPEVRAGNLVTEEVPSPWFRVNWNTTSSMMVTVPPGQADHATPTDGTAQTVAHPPALKMKMYAKLDTPLSLGTTDAGTASNGDTDTNGFTIQASMNYLMEYVNMTQAITSHHGEKAYPSQAA